MADGTQRGFNFPRNALTSALRPGEIVVDFFAGGGGASEALRQALGRDPDVAVNHDHLAIGMHAANHPFTRHMEADVYAVNIVGEVGGRPVGWGHFSPDCTDHSQAKGGQPRDRATRSLSWVVLKVAGSLDRHGLAPRIISLENVRQILRWGPLVAKRDKATGRVMKLDGTVAAPGERVPLRKQFLVPDKKRSGQTWRQFVAALNRLGYAVEWRLLDAADYGAVSNRVRLFMIARRDGLPIRWPAPSHGQGCQETKRTATDIINWDLKGTSIFNRARPLRPNTIFRLLDGAQRGNWPHQYVDALIALRDGREPRLDITLEEAEYIARRMGHDAGLIMATGSGGVARPLSSQVPTITTGGNGAAPHFVRPVLMGTQGTARARSVDGPMAAITTGGAGSRRRPGCARPQLFEPIVAPYYGSGSGMTGKPCSEPLPTVTTKARFGLVEPVIISTCNSSSRGMRLACDPLRTITTAKGGDMGLGEPVLIGYRIDILYRMLVERELFNAQGFPPDYIIDRAANGRRITRTQAIRMVGNSVSPPPLCAIARANLDPATVPERLAA